MIICEILLFILFVFFLGIKIHHGCDRSFKQHKQTCTTVYTLTGLYNTSQGTRHGSSGIVIYNLDHKPDK